MRRHWRWGSKFRQRDATSCDTFLGKPWCRSLGTTGSTICRPLPPEPWPVKTYLLCPSIQPLGALETWAKFPGSPLVRSGPGNTWWFRDVPLCVAEQPNTTLTFLLRGLSTAWCWRYHAALGSLSISQHDPSVAMLLCYRCKHLWVLHCSRACGQAQPISSQPPLCCLENLGLSHGKESRLCSGRLMASLSFHDAQGSLIFKWHSLVATAQVRAFKLPKLLNLALQCRRCCWDVVYWRTWLPPRSRQWPVNGPTKNCSDCIRNLSSVLSTSPYLEWHKDVWAVLINQYFHLCASLSWGMSSPWRCSHLPTSSSLTTQSADTGITDLSYIWCTVTSLRPSAFESTNSWTVILVWQSSPCKILRLKGVCRPADRSSLTSSVEQKPSVDPLFSRAKVAVDWPMRPVTSICTTGSTTLGAPGCVWVHVAVAVAVLHCYSGLES